jgi:diguanylate cyclase (GGDEF)-like protein
MSSGTLVNGAADGAAAIGLHPGTLLFSISMFGFVMAGFAFSAAHAMPARREAALTWCQAMGAAGGGFLLYFLRGNAPWFLTFVVANLLAIGCAGYGYVAFAQLLSKIQRRKAVAVVTAFGMSGVLATYYLDTPIRGAVITISAAIAGLLGLAAMLLSRQAWVDRSAIVGGAAVATAATSVAFAARAMVAVFGDVGSVSPNASSPTQVGALLSGAVFIVAASVSFFSLLYEQQRQDLLEATSRDSLTGVRTRAAFFEQVEQMEKAAHPTQYAVLMVDIDRFKHINDNYGHAVGDLVLAHAGRLLGSSVRISDVVGRYGGEEFCILLRECTETQTAALAQRAVEEAAQQSVRLPNGLSLKYTVSVGFAVACQLEGRVEPFSEAIERADQALLRAKREGRNRAIPAALSAP